MKLSPNLKPFASDYPSQKKIPKNLLNSPLKKKFHHTHKKYTFQEQFANEPHPHRVKHISYQFGKIGNRNAIMFFLDKQPARLIYSDLIDPYVQRIMSAIPPRTTFPPNSVSSNLARTLREDALKWIVDQFFNTLNYMCFDEPILDGVNPDSLALPISQTNEILALDSRKYEINEKTGQKLVEVDLPQCLFIEIKAYHGTTIIGEKELLQAFNYAIKGNRALLITTGAIGTYDTLNMLNQSGISPDQTTLVSTETFDEKNYKAFVATVKKKFRKLIRKLDMNISQDSYDTRGIYISAGSKLDKIYKYTSDWPNEISFESLQTPNQILDFIHSGKGLGVVYPQAFEQLLHQRQLNIAANLFKRIYETYIEEIMINPPLLYPREDDPFYLSKR